MTFCLQILGYIKSTVAIVYLQEDERQRKMDLEMGGWTEAPEKTEGAISAQLGDTDDMTHPTEEGHSDVVERKF